MVTATDSNASTICSSLRAQVQILLASISVSLFFCTFWWSRLTASALLRMRSNSVMNKPELRKRLTKNTKYCYGRQIFTADAESQRRGETWPWESLCNGRALGWRKTKRLGPNRSTGDVKGVNKAKPYLQIEYFLKMEMGLSKRLLSPCFALQPSLCQLVRRQLISVRPRSFLHLSFLSGLLSFSLFIHSSRPL